MLKHFTLSVVLSCLGLFVSSIVLFFGNNILQRFQRAELVYMGQQMELRFPNKLKLKEKYTLNDSVPNFYREIRIKNLGGMPSKNLKIVINLDGLIYDINTTCIETITSIKIDNSLVEINLERLVKNAEIICKIWLIQKPGSLSIKSIDDQGINNVENFEQRNNSDYLVICSIIAIILITLFLIYTYYISPIIIQNQNLREQNIELQEQKDFVSNELNEIKVRFEENEASTDIISKLETFLSKHGSDVVE